MLTIYEAVHALATIYNQTPDSVSLQVGLNVARKPTPVPLAYDVKYLNYVERIFVTDTITGSKMIYPPSMSLVIAKNTFDQKFKLIDDKKKALTNISNKTAQMSDSNVTVLNNAFETARRAFEFRLNLELSVLNSQLKSIDIEIAKIKLMTAEEFTAKYGV